MSQIDSADDAAPPMQTPGTGWVQRIGQALRDSGAHPARTVVLLPYAQLMPLAQHLWAQAFPVGFMPRFETTQNWLQSLPKVALGLHDLRFEMASDVLTARHLLEQAGWAAQAQMLAPTLVESAYQVAPLAAAVVPELRLNWSADTRQRLLASMENPALALEAVVAQTALAWTGISTYASDALFHPEAPAQAEHLIVVQGVQPDPLQPALQRVWGERMTVLGLQDTSAQATRIVPVRWHAARDAQDEAQRAAACVLMHIEAGRTPVALVATDRVLTRRVRAMLAPMGVRLRDETGWKLSTSRSAAHVMAALRACARRAPSDAVLDWLKNAPAFAAEQVRELETALRREGVPQWHEGLVQAWPQRVALSEMLVRVQALRAGMQARQPLADWLHSLRALLVQSGQWDVLVSDEAGQTVLNALHLESPADDTWPTLLREAPWARKRLALQEFTQWVDRVLEAASFRPAHPPSEDVVILPMSQMLARPFAAVVMPGCDEVRLNPSPEPPGLWTGTQRALLGLPSRDALCAQAHAVWCEALRSPQVDVLWRKSDDSGETLLASAWAQALRLSPEAEEGADPRTQRTLAAQPVHPPAPCAPGLNTQRLSASAYEDLRRCPYRFFALRQLGLQSADELEAGVDKRDFGLWLHAVLKVFHDALKQNPTQDAAARVSLMDAAAERVRLEHHLAEDEFLPFLALWPSTRQGYLKWLAEHEAQGAEFVEGERWQETRLGELTLVGQLDRLDRVGATAAQAAHTLVMDYKTESEDTTRKRIQAGPEDTQLAFYAALLQDDALRAAYVNVGERGETHTVVQPELMALRDLLQTALQEDMRRIDAGAALHALGAESACEHCAARGLCRKDFWEGA